jgi:hypothetical protein
MFNFLVDLFNRPKQDAKIIEDVTENLQSNIDWIDARLKKLEENPKMVATENDEPWVSVVHTGFSDRNDPKSGFLELDWNEQFVKQLHDSGYSGRTDEEVVEMWLRDICRSIVDEPIE